MKIVTISLDPAGGSLWRIWNPDPGDWFGNRFLSCMDRTGSHLRGMFGSSTGWIVGNHATVFAESDIGIVMSDTGAFYRNRWLHRK